MEQANYIKNNFLSKILLKFLMILQKLRGYVNLFQFFFQMNFKIQIKKLK